MESMIDGPGMFRQTPPSPEFFDEDHLPSFLLGVVIFGASAVGVAVTDGRLSSVLALAVLSALCAAVALIDRRPVASAPWRTNGPAGEDGGLAYCGRVDDDDRPAPPSGSLGAADLFDWESFTEQFWAYVREGELSVPTCRRAGARWLRRVPARWKRRQRPRGGVSRLL